MKNNLPSNESIYAMFEKFDWLRPKTFIDHVKPDVLNFAWGDPLPDESRQKAADYFLGMSLPNDITPSAVKEWTDTQGKRVIKGKFTEWIREESEKVEMRINYFRRAVGNMFLPSHHDIYELFREFPWLNTRTFLNFTGITQGIFSNKKPLTDTQKKRAIRYFTQGGQMKLPNEENLPWRMRDWLHARHESGHIHLTGLERHLGISPTSLYRWVTGSRNSMEEGYFSATLSELERFREGGTKIVRRPTQN